VTTIDEHLQVVVQVNDDQDGDRLANCTCIA